MARKSKKEIDSEVTEAAVLQGAVIPNQEKHEVFDFETFKLETLADFDIYNAQVRKHNRFCLHERNKMHIKVPDESFYKKVKVKFQRFDQPQNVLKVRMRTKDIDYRAQLKPGGTYDLPIPVIKFLNKLSVPIFAEVKVNEGGDTVSETRQVGEQARFACNVLEFA